MSTNDSRESRVFGTVFRYPGSVDPCVSGISKIGIGDLGPSTNDHSHNVTTFIANFHIASDADLISIGFEATQLVPGVQVLSDVSGTRRIYYRWDDDTWSYANLT